MKSVSVLNEGWRIHRLPTQGPLSDERVQALSDEATAGFDDWLDADMPAEVQEVLLAHGRIEDPRKLDNAEQALWVAEADWVYRTTFQAPGGRGYLLFRGLDTIVDVYLNGQLVAQHEDMYLPLRVELDEDLPETNVLLLHVHSPHAWLERQTMPPEYGRFVRKNRLLRKPHEDFNSFNGPSPYFTPLGVYDDVELVVVDRAEIAGLDIDYRLADGYASATVWVELAVSPGVGEGAQAEVELLDEAGTVVARGSGAVEACDGGPGARCELTVDAPALWWPRGYGDQPLYELSATLRAGGDELDRAVRTIGFREMEMDGSFDLRVNGVQVKLWGANFAPMEQLTHVWPGEKLGPLLDLAENANMVTLRAWGPGAPYGEGFYDECDRRGLLVWAELFHTWGMYPETPEYTELCRREAEHFVASVKHHACIYMWCGGNEVYMGSDVMYPGRRVLSKDIYETTYRDVCARLDPRRYYHPSSPCGGAYPNDPFAGDTHAYTHHWYVPGATYGVLLTENARWSPPQLRTLKRYIPDESQRWPEGFESRLVPERPLPGEQFAQDAALIERDLRDEGLIPPAWQLLGKSPRVTGRTGPIGDFYDTGRTPEGTIYRLGSSHGLFIRRCVERLRCGRAVHETGPRRSMGHYWWRLNGTWPQIETELVDYLNEPKMAYYATRRVYAPIFTCFEFGDHIHVWVVNDTPDDLHAELVVEQLDTSGRDRLGEIRRRVTMPAGESKVICDLDEWGMFLRQNILVARVIGDDGSVLARTVDFAYEERNIPFPDAKIDLAWRDGAIEITTDQYAHAVELIGDADGDEFGWGFEDNYFDVLPGETHRVGLLGRHRKGVVRGRPFFSSEGAEVEIG